MIRHATAVWNGSGKEGKGQLSTESGAIQNIPYTYKMRFEDEPGTNPEELVAAAHAGCFTMKLSFILGEAGFTPDTLETRCDITFEAGTVKKSQLNVRATVPGIGNDTFQECVEKAKQNCPVSKLLNAEIVAEASLT